MDVDVEAVVGLELEGRLHAAGTENLLRCIACGHLGRHGRNLRHLADVITVLLGVVVAGDPVRGVVARHRELGEFLRNHEIYEAGLLREFVAEAEAVIVKAEAHDHLYALLLEGHGQFVVVVAYLRLFSPDGVPSLVQAAGLAADELESALHVHRGLILLAGVVQGPGRRDLVPAELEAEFAREYRRPVAEEEFVGGGAVGSHPEIERQGARRALDGCHGVRGGHAHVLCAAGGDECKGREEKECS